MSAEKQKFDVAIIGSGPGGYPAAIKLAQGGKSVALIEAKEVGGTCLNRGCIPTKTLIANADILQRLDEVKEMGISVSGVTFDYEKMVDRKDQIVEKIRSSLEGLLNANRITILRGYGKLIAPGEIKIAGKDQQVIYADNVIIATGSEPRDISTFPFDYERIHSSTSILELKQLPKKLAVIGGGIIGCEFASLYAILGVEVTLIEMMPTLLPTECKTVSSALTKAFQKRGIKIYTHVKVEAIEKQGKGVKVKLPNGVEIDADMALVAVGRRLNTDAIGLEKIGLAPNDNGMITVNDKMETDAPGVYAIGDIASKWWLAHVATHQGIVAARNILGEKAHINYDAIPAVIFTMPEIGTVGLTLDQAIARGYQALLSPFPFQVLGKSQAANQTEGFAQIVVDKKTGQILGAQVVGHEAGTLVAEMALAIANELTVECVVETIHAHPTISEAWMEAAFLSSGAPLHLPPKSKVLAKV